MPPHIFLRFHGEGKIRFAGGVYYTGKFEKGKAVEVRFLGVENSHIKQKKSNPDDDEQGWGSNLRAFAFLTNVAWIRIPNPASHVFVVASRPRRGGGGVLPYIGYIGICRGIGYGF